MQSRRSRSAAAGAAALAAAVIGSVLGTPSPAHAAPAAPAATASDTPGTAAEQGAAEGAPAVYPRPQSLEGRGAAAAVTEQVTVVAGMGAERSVLDAVRSALKAAGAREVTTVDAGAAPAGGGLRVYVEGPAAEKALRALDAPRTADLPPGGYVLAAGRATVDGRAGDVVALYGADADGAFHGAQTLRQLAADGAVPGVAVRDWPTTAVRGIVEGFYGEPWTQAQRLSQMDFLGRTKQNRYLYAPGADPYRQVRWREDYPKAQAARLRQLADRARRNHVTLAWAVSPGQSLCFSSDEDRRALQDKLDSLWDLGVRAYQLQFQDVSYDEWHCGADRERYGTGPEAAARAQADVANAVADWLAARHSGSQPLSVLPTEFYQDGDTAYRDALAAALDERIEVAWTGVGVVPRTITGTELAAARDAFGHPLVTMDNYPVNDFAQDRVFLGPYTGRDPAVANASSQLLANAMRQPVASRIALFTAADFAWNPRAYQAADSWRAALADLSAGDADQEKALTTLARNNASSALDTTESAYLLPLIESFWSDVEQSGPALRAAFTEMAQAPGRLGAVEDGALAEELRPWIEQLGRYGEAGRAAVDMLAAQRRGDGGRAWAKQLAVLRLREELSRGDATVADGVLDPFLDRALRAADSWTGVGGDSRTATASLDASRGADPELMLDASDDTYYWSAAVPEAGDTFGVDLGAVRQVTGVRIAMGGKGSAGDDYLRDAVLEYSSGDGSGWHRVRAYHDRKVITAQLPAGTRMREIRLRATQTGTTKVAVRAFIVNTADTVRPKVSGGPAARSGAPLSAAADGDAATAYRAEAAPTGSPDAGALLVRFGATRPLDKVTLLTDPQVKAAAAVEAHLPGEGWRRLGRLGTGYTELAADGAEADAVRLSWAEGSPAPVVHEVVPWFADAPAARLVLRTGDVDVETGGSATVRADLSATRPVTARGEVTADAPAGITVSTPPATTLHRGGTVTAPLTVAVPADTAPGDYRVPVRLKVGSQEVVQDLTVHAYPPTGGPDLARTATATSSADETPDFPASAATDGDPGTRWSSPAADGEWLQLELAEPARVGRLVLTWQDAYASAYQVQTSADGRRWRTAATVREGAGKKETLRFDAPGTRYIRVQGVTRATKYGYSLYSVEAYAVTE